MGYIKPQDRHQIILFNYLDEAVDADNIVRVIDALVDEMVAADPTYFLDRGLSEVGRPSYHPASLLKLYLYGYLNGIRSSRKLERECKRNLELMWLMGNLAPDFKTIADYRKDQGEQIQEVFVRWNFFLKAEGLIVGKTLSLDGTKMRANAQQGFSKKEQTRLLAKEKEFLAQCQQYLAALDQADGQEGTSQDALPAPPAEGESSAPEVAVPPQAQEDHSPDEPRGRTEVEADIAASQARIQQLEQRLEEAQQTNQDRFCTTDPEARMIKSRQGTHWCYNVQSNVDVAEGMILDIEARSSCNDRSELVPALERIQAQYNIVPEEQAADAGYGNIEEILSLQSQGADPEDSRRTELYIPLITCPQKIVEKQNGLTFTYDQKQDQYTCGKGNALTLIKRNRRDSKTGALSDVYRADAQACNQCELKAICAPRAKKGRSIHRYHTHEAREAYRQKLASEKGKQMRVLRSSYSEHPFGTIKMRMNAQHLLLRGRHKVNTEVRLLATAYNLLRSVNIRSTQEIIKQIRAFDWTSIRKNGQQTTENPEILDNKSSGLRYNPSFQRTNFYQANRLAA